VRRNIRSLELVSLEFSTQHNGACLGGTVSATQSRDSDGPIEFGANESSATQNRSVTTDTVRKETAREASTENPGFRGEGGWEKKSNSLDARDTWQGKVLRRRLALQIFSIKFAHAENSPAAIFDKDNSRIASRPSRQNCSQAREFFTEAIRKLSLSRLKSQYVNFLCWQIF
jgi:hypothetical protein